MKKRATALIFAVLLSVFMCGCSLFTANTDELMKPPELAGDLKQISTAISKSVGADYTFKYPSRGDYRSAVIREDIDGDGLTEAFAFYSTSDDETVTMNINAVGKTDNGWESVAYQQIVAGGVDKIVFCDLDNDGKKEILVGWEVYGTSEMQLAVYSLSGKNLTQRMLQRYTHFAVCDLDDNGQNEIMIIKTSVEEPNTASLYILTDEGVSQISSCRLDSTAKTVTEPILSTLSNGKPAFYIDEVKGAGSVTEVIFWKKDALVNPLYSEETGETTATLRAVSLTTTDINGDGILEIPVQESVPSATKTDANEKLYLTNWCSFGGAQLTNQMTAMMNTGDGYYLTIPPKWAGKIAILKDTDDRVREICKYNPDDSMVGGSLLYIKAVKLSDWTDGKYKTTGVEEIDRNDSTAFICKISDAAKADGMTIDGVKKLFKITE